MICDDFKGNNSTMVLFRNVEMHDTCELKAISLIKLFERSMDYEHDLGL